MNIKKGDKVEITKKLENDEDFIENYMFKEYKVERTSASWGNNPGRVLIRIEIRPERRRFADTRAKWVDTEKVIKTKGKIYLIKKQVERRWK